MTHKILFLAFVAIVPILIGTGFKIAWAFTFFLFVALAASLREGFEWLCNLPLIRRLRFRRGLIATILMVAWTAILIVGSLTLGPLLVQGGIDGVNSTTVFVGTLPERYSALGNESYPWLEKLGVTKDMIDMVTAYLREHTTELQDYLKSLVRPSTEAAKWLGGFLFRGTINVMIAALLPYGLIIMLYLWPKSAVLWEALTRSLLPHRVAEYVIRWWQLFTCLASKIVKVMGISALILTSVYLVILLIGLKLVGYSMTPSNAAFNAVILGVTSAVPVFGGMLNYATIVVVSLVNFSFDWWILAILLLVVVAVHAFEANVVTQLLLGKHLEFDLIGIMGAFYVGLACWGATLNGIGMFLFLPPFWRACKMLADEIWSERPVYRFKKPEIVRNRPVRG